MIVPSKHFPPSIIFDGMLGKCAPIWFAQVPIFEQGQHKTYLGSPSQNRSYKESFTVI